VTKPITYGARVGGIWYVCVFGRYGSGQTVEQAFTAASLRRSS